MYTGFRWVNLREETNRKRPIEKPWCTCKINYITLRNSLPIPATARSKAFVGLRRLASWDFGFETSRRH